MQNLVVLNRKLTENVEILGIKLKKKELFLVADGPREHTVSIGPESLEKKKG
jgi:hypothetical protein